MESKVARPFMLVTIDAEGDDLWSGRRDITTHNALYLQRFQKLCEKYSLRPTWLTDYDMASCSEYIEFASDVLSRRAGEIGMHLHAWSTPPEFPLTESDYSSQPYLFEYPDEIMEQKIDAMTGLLEDTFRVKMTSHRAGRWGFDARYARMLAERGYLVDCSVTPHISWRRYRGDPGGSGGPDYRGFPTGSYFPDPDDIRREGDLRLLEVPVTIAKRGGKIGAAVGRAVGWNDILASSFDKICRPVAWLRPNGRNREEMTSILQEALADRRDYAQFMIHSSELMPGGSPNFRDGESVEALYRDLETIFEFAHGRYIGCTLTEYYGWRTRKE